MARSKKSRIVLKHSFRLAVVFLGVPGIALVTGTLLSLAPNLVRQIPNEIWNFLVLFPLLFAVYKILPNKKVNPWAALMAAFVTATISSVSPLVYVWVTSGFLDYNKVYGTLAFLPLFLIWVFILWLVFLFGVVLTVWLQHRVWGLPLANSGAEI